MKYYSEALQKFYNTPEECEEAESKEQKAKEEAEKKAKALKEQRKERAAEVEKALDELNKAEKHYRELLDKFLKDYGAFHYTYTYKDNDLDSFFNWPYMFL